MRHFTSMPRDLVGSSRVVIENTARPEARRRASLAHGLSPPVKVSYDAEF
jgi:hypothetical protein